MLRSMTGFGRGEAGDSNNIYTIEIKSVNNRFMEINTRFPRKFAEMETMAKQNLKDLFSRGSFDINISFEGTKSSTMNLKLDSDLARQYILCARGLKDEFGINGEMDLNALLNINGILKMEELEIDKDSSMNLIASAMDKALVSIKDMKEREGEIIHRDFEERMLRISQWVEDINDKIPEITGEFQEKFRQKLNDALGDIKLDEARLAQEVVLWVSRGDISEELTRLRSHIIQFKETMESGPPIGRKLEFILQEINREASTIGSKSMNPFISEIGVSIKCELERIREQVLNVE